MSDEKLSNTLTPHNISSNDFRSTTGLTNSSGDRKAQFSREGGEWYTGWNNSVAGDGPAERQQQLFNMTAKSKQQTMKSTQILSNYTSPVRRQEQIIEAVREHKKLYGVDVKELTAKYGPEGAESMQHILTMPKKESGTRIRIKATQEDILAVQSLPDEVLVRDVSSPSSSNNLDDDC